MVIDKCCTAGSHARRPGVKMSSASRYLLTQPLYDLINEIFDMNDRGMFCCTDYCDCCAPCLQGAHK